MEFVKDAIEKARQQRETLTGKTTKATTGRASDAGGEAGSEGVQYSQTRKEPLNAEVLLANRVVAVFEDDERAQPYRHLRTQVLQKMRVHGWRTLAITSAHANAGKTLTAANLAVALAKEANQTVLLVDLDFKGPNVLDTFGLTGELGFVDYLLEKVELQDILVNPGLERLTILPALPVAGATSEILSSPRMKATLEEVVGRYQDRILVFDLPPLLRDDDALVFTPYVDATLFVVENGVTTPSDIERCTQLLQGVNLIGTVFNKAD